MCWIFYKRRSRRVAGAFCDIYSRLDKLEVNYQYSRMERIEKWMMGAELVYLASRIAAEVNIPIIKGHCDLSTMINLNSLGRFEVKTAHRLMVRKILRLAHSIDLRLEIGTILEQSLLHL